jgi:hypothetical protein
MNVYGNARMTSERTANAKIVQMVLPEMDRLAVAA